MMKKSKTIKKGKKVKKVVKPARKTVKKTVKKVSKAKPKKVLKKKVVKKKTKPVVKKKVVQKPRAKRVIDKTVHQPKARVIGIGGGGSTVVSEITSRIKKADFYVANTDAQALKESSKTAKRFQFGQNFTHGLGTGMNVELGERAAHEEADKIEKILKGQDLCIIIACLGGGTSSGATPVFANISKKLGNITYGIFTLPFEFEGEKKMEAALESLEKIKPYLNVYTVIPNERIFNIVDKNTPLKDALSEINKRLADNLEGLIEMIYSPGLINIDFADLRTILSGQGRLTYLNTVEIEDVEKEDAVKKLISSPLHPYTIKGSRGILYNIVSSKNIQLMEVSKISNIVSESVNKNAKIIFGINQSNAQGKIKITLLATGCSAKEFLSEYSLKPKKKPKIKKAVKKIKEVVKIIKEKSEPKEKPIEKPKKEVKKIEEPKKEEEAPKIITVAEKPKEPEKVIDNQPKVEPAVVKEPTPGNVAVRIVPTVEPEIPKIRKNALQVREEAEQAEKEILEQEKIWDVPAILRRKK